MKKIYLSILLTTLLLGSIFASGAIVTINKNSNIELSNSNTFTVFSSSVDGYLRCGGIGKEYEQVREASVSDEADTTGTYIRFGQKDLGAGSSHSWYTDRGFLYFNTSLIPDDAEINSVIFSFFISGVYYENMNRELQVFYDPNRVYPHMPLETGDYSLDHYVDSLAGSFVFDSIGLYSWSWDPASFDIINKDSWTKIMVTTKSDWDGSSDNYWAWSQIWSGDYSPEDNPDYEPYLSIEYTKPNSAPNTPDAPTGPSEIYVDEEGSYSAYCDDPDGDDISYGWDWDGDYLVDEWSNFLDSGSMDARLHSWDEEGTYNVRVKAKDVNGAESEFSSAKIVVVSEPPINSDIYFVQITDTHVKYVADRESKTQENFKRVINAINSFTRKPEFVLITGDLVEWGGNKSSGAQNYEAFIDCLYKKDEQFYLDSYYQIPVYTIPGNHDYRNINLLDVSLDNYHQYIDKRNRYIVNHEGLSLFLLDSGHDYLDEAADWARVLGDGLYDEDIDWLQSNLNNCESNYKIIVMHHPAVNERDIFGLMRGVIARNRDTFLDLCETYNIDLVLGGHTDRSAVYDSNEKSYEGFSSPLNCSLYPTLYVQTNDCKENASYRNITIVGSDVWLHPSQKATKSRAITKSFDVSQPYILKSLLTLLRQFLEFI